MNNSVLLDKSKAFALEVIRLCNEVKTKRENLYGRTSLFGLAPVLEPILEKRFMPMEELTILPDFILRRKSALKVSIG